MGKADETEAFEKRVYTKVTWRLVPFLFLCYLFNFLDRVNIGFAKLQMQEDLGWSDTVYGIGMGVFFIGYFLFEVPSNLLLHRFGARLWMARIMVSWGLISSSMMFLKTPETFYILRFLLGFAEAGFFPGIILYFTYWYPARHRARICALFLTAVSASGVVGGPVSGWIIQTFHSHHGLEGWQWLFLLEGVPSVLLGLIMLVFLDNSIREAKWLSDREKDLLERNLDPEREAHLDFPLGQVLRNGRVWLLSLIYFSFVMGLYGVGFWLPQLIKDSGVKNFLDVGLLSAIPYGVATVVMVAAARYSDWTGERQRPIVWGACAAALGLILCGLYGNRTVEAMTALCLATAGTMAVLPIFWTLPTEFLRGTAAAAGIALINSVGNLAGFLSPYMVGAIRDATHKTAPSLYVIAASLLLGGFLVTLIPRRTP
jgi:D-galactonate transporter